MRANQHLKTMADAIGEELPGDIVHAMRVAPYTLETMWDERAGFYFCRDAVSGKLIKLPSAATFLPLYAQQLPKERVQRLVEHLHNPKTFGAPYPVPSAPLDSPYFRTHCYWQGPSWVNINWLLIDGLRRNGQAAEAERLKQLTLGMVDKFGFHEYYSPLDGSTAGAPEFSWSAALTIDLLAEGAPLVRGAHQEERPVIAVG